MDTTQVWVRDSRRDTGPVLNYTHEEWNAFVRGVKDGQFDVPMSAQVAVRRARPE